MTHHRGQAARALMLAAAGIALLACSQPSATQDAQGTGGRYAALDTLPDFAGTWYPNREAGQPGPRAPLNAEAQAVVKRNQELSDQGRPYGYSAGCLPAGGPSFWTGPDGVEIVMSPNKVFIWGRTETDGNYLARVAIDGRPHSPDPDPTFMGESIGTWEGDTLVIDTIGFLPEVPVANNLANEGGMHIVSRLHLTDSNTMQLDMEVTSPNILTETWKYTATYKRMAGQEYEAHEYICIQNGADKLDAEGYQYLDVEAPTDALEFLKTLK